MRQDVIQVFFALLRCEMIEREISADIKNIVTEDRLVDLFTFSKKHDLAHLIGYILDKKGLFSNALGAKKLFLQEWRMSVYRCEQLQYEFGRICAVLEEEKILFVPLKGSVIRSLYSEPWMRTSCDIDILVSIKNLDKARTVLENRLGYTFRGTGDHDITLIAESGVHLELHYALLESGAKATEKTVLTNIWKVVERAEGKYAHCKMPDEYFYCYHMSHIAKHLRFGGCGIRSILDTWFLNHKMDFDKSKRDSLLQQAGLLTFAKSIENLTQVWVGGKQASELDEELEQYILTGGVYGTMQNRVAVKINTKQGKFRYLCSRIFLPYRELKFKYPRLQKWPILFPFYQVKRWFRLLKKDSRERSVRELKETTHGDVEKQERVAKLLKDLDL